MTRAYSLLLLLFVLLAVFCTAIRFSQPVYTDDVTYVMTSTRLFIQNGDLWRWFTQCGNENALKPSGILYFFFAMWAFLGSFVSSIVDVAVVSLVRGVLSIGVYFLLIASHKSTLRVSIADASLACIGSAVVWWTMGRPEGWLILTLFVGIYGALQNKKLHWLVQIVFLACFSLLFGLSLTANPQFVFFVPVYLIVTYVFYRKQQVHYVSLLIVALSSLWFLGTLLPFATQLTHCPLKPQLQTYLESISLTPHTIVTNPAIAFRQIGTNILEFISHLRWLSVYDAERVSYNDLPYPLSYSIAPRILLVVTNVLVWILSISLLLFFFLRTFFTAGSLLKRRQIPHEALIQCALGACLTAWICLRTLKLSYHVSLFYPVFVMSFIIESKETSEEFLINPLRRVIRVCSMPAAVLSIILCSIVFYNNASPQQESIYANAVSLSDEPLSADDATELLRSCGTDRHSITSIVVDDATYFAVKDFSRILHALYLTQWSPDNPDPVQFARESGAKYFLERCGAFPSLEKGKRFQRGAYCCYSYATDTP
jgi:hypothetical protein